MNGRQRIHEQVFFYGLIVLVALMPFNFSVTNLPIIILSANWLVEGRFSEKARRLRDPLLLIFLAFFLLHVIAMAFTDNLTSGWFSLEKKSSLLVLPLVIGLTAHVLTRDQVNRILATFLASCIVLSLICLGNATYWYMTDGTLEYFTYEGLTFWLGNLQPNYVATYIAFAGVVLLHFLFTIEFAIWRRVAMIVLLLYLFAFSLLTAARTPTFAMAAATFLGAFYYSYRAGKLKYLAVVTVVIAMAGVAMIMKIESLKERVTSLTETEFYFDPAKNNVNGLTLRLVKWECSLLGIADAPLFGQGPGDAQDYLTKCYNDKEFWGRLYDFNSHNQYLQTALGLGIIGLVSLICMLAFPGIVAWKTRYPPYLLFLIVISICFLTESVLERKMGVVFYGFFNSLFAFHCIQRAAAKQPGA